MLWIINTYQNSLNSRLKCKRVDYNSDSYHQSMEAGCGHFAFSHYTFYKAKVET